VGTRQTRRPRPHPTRTPAPTSHLRAHTTAHATRRRPAECQRATFRCIGSCNGPSPEGHPQ
jgi:hypothetical protein